MNVALSESEMRMLLALAANPDMRRTDLAQAARLDPQEAQDVMLTLFRANYLSFNSIHVYLEVLGRSAVRELHTAIEKKNNDEQVRRGN